MKAFRKLVLELRNFGFWIRTHLGHGKERVENDIDFTSQFATPEYADAILRDGVDARTDPRWRETGADTADEYALWALTQCGMACTVMALKHFTGTAPRVTTLAKDAFANNVYKRVGNGLSGMHYREYCPWVARYRISAQFYTRLSLRGIQYALSRGGLVIVGVNPNIRGYETASREQKGGHLILVTGYDRHTDTITINNPSGFVSEGTYRHTLPTSDFLKFYTGRGIVLHRA